MKDISISDYILEWKKYDGFTLDEKYEICKNDISTYSNRISQISDIDSSKLCISLLNEKVYCNNVLHYLNEKMRQIMHEKMKQKK